MHLFRFSKENPGELRFRFSWLPMWMHYNQEVMQNVFNEARAAIPAGLKLENMTEEIWTALDQAAIKALKLALPYVTNVEKIIETLMDIEVDASKAPKIQLGRKASEDGIKPPMELGSPS